MGGYTGVEIKGWSVRKKEILKAACNRFARAKEKDAQEVFNLLFAGNAVLKQGSGLTYDEVFTIIKESEIGENKKI